MKRSLVIKPLFLCLFLYLCLLPLAHASSAALVPIQGIPSLTTNTQEDEGQSVFTPEIIQQRIEELQKDIDTLRSSQSLLLSEQVGLTQIQIDERQNLIESLIALYRRYVSFVERLEKVQGDYERQQADVQKDIAAFVPDSPPSSLGFYENYRGRLDTLSQEMETITYARRLSESAISSSNDKIRQAEQRIQMLKEEQSDTPIFEWEMQKSQLQLEKERITLALREKSVEENSVRLSMLETERKNVLEGLKWISQNLKYDEADLKRQVSQIKEREEELQKQASSLRKEVDRAREELVNAQTKVESETDSENAPVYRAQQKEKEAWYAYYQSALDQAEQAQIWAEETREIWETRYSLLQKELPTAELIKLSTEAEGRKKDLDNVLLGLQKQQVSLQSRLLTLDGAISAEQEGSSIFRALRRESEALKKQIELNTQYMTSLLSVSMLNSRLLEELEGWLSSVTLTEKVSLAGLERLKTILNFQLWSGDGYSISVKKLILAIVIVLFGFLISRKLTRGVKQRLLDRFDMDPTAAMALQKLIFFALIVAFILIALDMVNIPLTAFAFLGGALALGIGIGAQNIFSNLISGFILFISKPFRIHDTVQIDDILGTVEEIESRSTRIRTFDNVDVLVPNRYFLENRIINWNRTDQIIRGKVSVGVAYGSPVRDVERLLLVAASSHNNILTMPEPYAIFKDFGASTLDFDLYFWVDMRRAARFVVQSDLRYKIMELFAENNIEIAFPQLDLHFDTDIPLRVSVADNEKKDGHNEGDALR